MGKRTNWLDKDGDIAIDEMAKRLGTFIDTMADGVVTADELEAQEERVVGLMKEIEPKLDDELHAKVTELLCELTAFDIMQLLNTVQEARSETVWRP
jgi:hypothetical protein